jgi:hypothetical protein
MGHVFVVGGDLLKVHCSARLIPTSLNGQIMPYWREATGKKWRVLPADREGMFSGGRRSVALDEVLDLHGVRGPEHPVSVRDGEYWLTDIISGAPDDDVGPAGLEGDGFHDFVVRAALAGLRAFVAAAATSPCPRPLASRERPLLAVPVVGSGKSGGARVTGFILKALLDELEVLSLRHGVDLVLVCRDPAHLAAAQALRRREPRRWFGDLPQTLRERAFDLGQRAARGDLVLFLGAGVSVGAGLPDWKGLLAELAAMVGMGTELLGTLDPYDTATLLEVGFRKKGGGDDQGMRQTLAARFQAPQVSLVHAILAGVPTSEVVTTNYDDLYEKACAAAGQDLQVLPWDRPTPGGRFLLKLHGCVTRPDEIVLTRRDYLRFADRKAALSGIVQALLITRHMLFVGFSTDDANFHQIADAVRKALGDRAPDAERLGTVLDLYDHPARRLLWEGDLDWVGVGQAGESAALAARRVEIVLDAVGCMGNTGLAFLASDKMAGLHTPAEEKVAGLVLKLAQDLQASPGLLETEAGRFLAEHLGSLGVNLQDPKR